MRKLLLENRLLLLILLVGLVLRAYQPLALFQYTHDQDLAGWFVRDVLVSHHFRLVGQETSSHGVFIGPYFYYLQIPFYFLTKMDPSGTVLLSIIFGVFAVFSFYFVFKNIFTKNVGLIAATIYSFSILIVFTDREVAPTMPVMLWTVWFLFALWRILKNKKGGYLIVGLLVGLIWSVNLQLLILVPLVLLAQLFSRRKIALKEFLIGILIALVFNIPFLAFEVRHGFQQTKAVISSLTTNKDYVPETAKGLAKLDRVMQLVHKNTTSLYWDSVITVRPNLTFWALVSVFLFLVWKKKIHLKMGIILFLWQVFYIGFFTKVSLNISEYYLNGMNVVWILVLACGINTLLEKKELRYFGRLVLGIFVLLNLYGFVIRPVNANGYVERKAIISYIKEDAKNHNYPCVSLSFITSPGNNFGYRYFTWELGLKTKPVSDGVPVYSIVFPHTKVDRLDKTFGALGLVLPDYKRYNDKTIQKVCEGDDYTLTEPMFGFTN